MWYFSCMLGLGLALIFGILNAIWFEIREAEEGQAPHPLPGRPREETARA